MSHFTEAEIAYLHSQKLGRLATVNADGEPHISPVQFRYHPETDTIDIGGFGFASSKKLRDARAHPAVAFVVDDVAPSSKIRGIEIRGRAEVIETGGKAMRDGIDDPFIRIHPTRILGWGLEAGEFRNSRDVASEPAS